MRDKHVAGMKCDLRGRVYEGDEIVDIVEYSIENSKDNLFISENGKKEFCLFDFQYLIVPGKTMQNILEEAYNKGFEAGRKPKPKKVESEDETIEKGGD